MSLFHPFTNQKIQENSAKAVCELFDGRYNVKSIKQTSPDTYYVNTRDGGRIKVRVGEKTNIFGEKRSYIRTVDDVNWFGF